jgi:signal transduction histidine kinase
MKLFQQYNRVNLLLTIVVFILSGIAFYFVLHYTLLEQMDEDLKIEEREISSFVTRYDSLPQLMEVNDQQIRFVPVKTPVTGRQYKTIIIPGDQDDYRELIFGIKATGKWYAVHVRKSLEATDHITQSVFMITFSTIFLILIVTVVINRTLLRKLWQPFYNSLLTLQDFKIADRQPLKFQATRIDEFRFMNETLERTTAKALHDYDTLKEFTENASHELQTPLAIIRSKMEVLMQGDNLTAQQFAALQGATDALNKLSRMNHALLLLAKIENEQFASKALLDVTELVARKITQFKELWEEQALQITTDIREKVQWEVNRELIEILLNNLFSNATRHNYAGGKVSVLLTATMLRISNTGGKASLDKTRLFERFYNPSNNNNSNGLGLAVIQQICTASGLEVTYSYEDDLHIFTILLPA